MSVYRKTWKNNKLMRNLHQHGTKCIVYCLFYKNLNPIKTSLNESKTSGVWSKSVHQGKGASHLLMLNIG